MNELTNQKIMGVLKIGNGIPTSGSPSITYGNPTDTCCVCNRKLSRYNPDQVCAAKTCKQQHELTHKKHECRKPRKQNEDTTIKQRRAVPMI